MSIISANSSIGSAVPTYLVDSKNEQSLAAEWAKANGQVQSDITHFQSKASTLTSVDALMNDYQSLKVILTAYNVPGLLSYPGLVRQLLTQDPTSSSSVAEKIGNPAYLNFAKAMNQLQGNPLGTSSNVSAIVSSYKTNSFEVAQNTQVPGMQNALAFKRLASQITTIPELMANPAVLTVAVAQTGLNYTIYGLMSYNQQVALLTKSVKLSDLQNPKTVNTMAEQYLLQAAQDPTDWNTSSTTTTVASLFGGSSSTSELSLFGGGSNEDPVLSMFA